MSTGSGFRDRAAVSIGVGLFVGILMGAIEGLFLNVTAIAHAGVEILYGAVLYGALGTIAGLGLALIRTLAAAAGVRRSLRPPVVTALAFHSAFFVFLLVGYRLNKVGGMPPAGTPQGLMVNALFLAAVVFMGFVLAAFLGRWRPETWTRMTRALSRASLVLIALPIVILACAVESVLFPDGMRSGGGQPVEEEKGRPNVIILLSDALRKDHLSGYGYERRTSLAIDHLMDESVTFDNAFASSNSTIPSIASLFTGIGPAGLGPLRAGSPLPSEPATLSEAMARAGYLCGCFLGNAIVEVGGGFLRGFHYRYPPPRPFWCYRMRTAAERIAIRLVQRSDSRGGPRLLEEARIWIESHPDRALFAFIHLLDPDSPYDPPPPYDTLFDPDYDGPPMRKPPAHVLSAYRYFKEWEMPAPGEGALPELQRHNMVARYDGEIAYVDELIRGFLEHLVKMGLYDNTLVIFTSAHGEEFYEHSGWLHGYSLYDELVRIPLVVKFPGQTPGGTRRTDPVVGYDLMPSVLTVVGAGVPEGVEGYSVFGETDRQPEDRPIFSERPPYLYSVREERWKLIREESEGGADLRLFDLVEDPGEKVNVAARYPDVRDRLAAKIDARVAEVPGGIMGEDAGGLNPYDRERLKALGYLQ